MCAFVLQQARAKVAGLIVHELAIESVVLICSSDTNLLLHHVSFTTANQQA